MRSDFDELVRLLMRRHGTAGVADESALVEAGVPGDAGEVRDLLRRLAAEFFMIWNNDGFVREVLGAVADQGTPVERLRELLSKAWNKTPLPLPDLDPRIRRALEA